MDVVVGCAQSGIRKLLLLMSNEDDLSFGMLMIEAQVLQYIYVGRYRISKLWEQRFKSRNVMVFPKCGKPIH